MKILLIEDDREAADYLQKAFAEAGHTVHLAADGDTGYAMADGGDYDVMVVDRMLPRRDGLSVVAGLRSRGNATPHARCAICTSPEQSMPKAEFPPQR